MIGTKRGMTTSLRMLGVDVGEVWYGLALSDTLGLVCTPLDTLEADWDRVAEQIAAIAERNRVARIVVGIPVSLDGKVKGSAKRSRHTIRLLRKIVEVPVVGWDERFTTAEAIRYLRESGSSSRQIRGKIDSAAAAILLESYISSLRSVS